MTTYQYDHPSPDSRLADAIILTQNVVAVELDDYTSLGMASITINTFIVFLELLMDANSEFSKWYATNKSIIKNIDDQYDGLKGAVCFNNHVESYCDTIRNILRMYSTFTPIHTNTTPIQNQKIPLKMQTGGNIYQLIGKPEEFIVLVMKYINNDSDSNSIHINDIFTAIFNKYYMNLHIISRLKKRDDITDTSYETNMIYLNVCHLTINSLLIEKLKLYTLDKYTTYAGSILEISIQDIIKDYITFSGDDESEFSGVTILRGIVKDGIGGVNLADKQEVKNAINMLDVSTRYVNNTLLTQYGLQIKYYIGDNYIEKQINRKRLEIRLAQKMYLTEKERQDLEVKLANMKIYEKMERDAYEEDIEDKEQQEIEMRAKFKEKQVMKEQKEKEQKEKEQRDRIEKKKLRREALEKKISEERERKKIGRLQKINRKLDIVNKSGIDKSYQRRVFLVKISDNLNFAIKISTDEFPEYKMEGQIYSIFGNIMNDTNEPKREIISDHVLKCHYFTSMDNITQNNQFNIYLNKNLGFIASSSVNAELYNAIKNIAIENGRNSIYYYVTENVLGLWKTLDESTMTINNKCNLTINVFKLLAYLNQQYNFTHWDLHTGNIFVQSDDPSKFKIYDFDLSEITYKNINVTNINNKLIDIDASLTVFTLPASTETMTQQGKDDCISIKNMPIEERKDIGLIYDIYRVFSTFTKFQTCGNNQLEFLKTMYDHGNTFVNNAQLFEENNYWGHLLTLTYELYMSPAISGTTAIVWIRNNYNSAQLVGGASYYKKYLKYKSKYLQLKNNNNKRRN